MCLVLFSLKFQICLCSVSCFPLLAQKHWFQHCFIFLHQWAIFANWYRVSEQTELTSLQARQGCSRWCCWFCLNIASFASGSSSAVETTVILGLSLRIPLSVYHTPWALILDFAFHLCLVLFSRGCTGVYSCFGRAIENLWFLLVGPVAVAFDQTYLLAFGWVFPGYRTSWFTVYSFQFDGAALPCSKPFADRSGHFADNSHIGLRFQPVSNSIQAQSPSWSNWYHSSVMLSISRATPRWYWLHQNSVWSQSADSSSPSCAFHCRTLSSLSSLIRLDCWYSEIVSGTRWYFQYMTTGPGWRREHCTDGFGGWCHCFACCCFWVRFVATFCFIWRKEEPADCLVGETLSDQLFDGCFWACASYSGGRSLQHRFVLHLEIGFGDLAYCILTIYGHFDWRFPILDRSWVVCHSEELLWAATSAHYFSLTLLLLVVWVIDLCLVIGL